MKFGNFSTIGGDDDEDDENELDFFLAPKPMVAGGGAAAWRLCFASQLLPVEYWLSVGLHDAECSR